MSRMRNRGLRKLISEKLPEVLDIPMYGTVGSKGLIYGTEPILQIKSKINTILYQSLRLTAVSGFTDRPKASSFLSLQTKWV